ncbi:hypothetical protein B0H13DRAFT_2171264, partial [Mycena leptocephala]
LLRLVLLAAPFTSISAHECATEYRMLLLKHSPSGSLGRRVYGAPACVCVAWTWTAGRCGAVRFFAADQDRRAQWVRIC